MERVWKNKAAEWIASEIPLFEHRVTESKESENKRYWQGQLDAHRFLAEAIERGDYMP